MASLESIIKKLREMQDDEVKAGPAYRGFYTDLINIGVIKPLTRESDILLNIIKDEERHKEDLNLIEKTIANYKIKQPKTVIGETLTITDLKNMYDKFGFKSGYDFNNWKQIYCARYHVKLTT
ncbi:MAG: hypothetical protein PHZ02_01215 [Desulfocapsaceae bacterium]|nr:hypothetical protein [Desulfocapsaceae bacterium]